ncbi:EAL domain-containing protein [Marinobacterium aestuarii]|uniref:two-component system response regulator n=1 Tax=Marinobacterium aestuarii TaxID=1821621 RepID=UPI000A9AC1ED|nr:EAL domain-containing protein [Marinobacterium aestuarii]
MIKLLIVADDLQTSDKISTLLNTEHVYDIQQCADVSQALILIGCEKVDLLFLCLPANYLLDNATLLTLQRCNSSIPIIVLDDDINDLTGRKLLNQAVADYLPLRTLAADTLQRAIRYVLGSQRQHAQIDYLRHADPLTSIGNRQFFYRQLLEALARIDSHQHGVALITVDLDGFRKFNNSIGHSAGDDVVRQLSQRLQTCLQDEQLCRIGGDEFAIILEAEPDTDLRASTLGLITRLMQHVSHPYQCSEREIMLPSSIGVAFAPEHSRELDSLIRQASQARLRAKQLHGCSYAIFEADKDTDPATQITLEPELWSGLRQEQFVLYYQPRIDLRTGKIIGAEALMRWNHPERGLVQPDEFIPIAEKTGLIVPMGYWAIHQAGQDMLKFKEAGFRYGSIGVNLSFRQFKDDFLAKTIRRIIDKNQIDPHRLEFELTETALFSDEAHVQSCLKELSALGIDFSLDDFGTGYSSFSLLQKLPISTLKIDKSFVAGVNQNKDDEEIVRAIINLAHNLQKKVIAEGVENKAQLEFLIRHDCDQVQGYFFSPPVPIEDFMRMLRGN